MKVTVFLLSILLLVSCSPENLWQKVGLASPEPIEITSKTGSPKGNEEDEVDVMKCFVGDRESVVSFSIRKPESLRGDILYPQDKKEAEKMAEMLNAKCFSQHQIKAFLSSEIEDKDLVFAMKNTVFRRDEIWFAAENPNHESEIYSLYEIRREDNERVNSTAAFDKQYMEGRYGADPYLTNMLSGGDWT